MHYYKRLQLEMDLEEAEAISKANLFYYKKSLALANHDKKLLSVLKEASQDEASISLSCDKYESYIMNSIKILRDHESDKVVIFNTTRNGDYYKMLDDTEQKEFSENGWRNGVYVISLSNYRLKLDKIEKKIKEEVNGKKPNIRYINNLKQEREEVLLKFSNINQKLNQLN
jgi:hypothetical protein|tara:strand:- start:2665 stop:3177 length:513 start_codon:yes stop_codon:yes gene_type:complete